MVSIITCTMRPSFMNQVFSNYRRQVIKEKELIVVLNQNDMDITKWNLISQFHKNVSIYKLPEDFTLGACLNFAISKANYDVIAKFDDDDYYAPYYLPEAVDELERKKASIVGKATSYIYFEENKALMLFRTGKEKKIYRKIKGGTLVFRKSVWDKVKFQDRAEKSDSYFLKDSKQQGFKIYSASKYNYVCIRRKDISTHTQKISTKSYMDRCKLIAYTNDYIPIISKSIN